MNRECVVWASNMHSCDHFEIIDQGTRDSIGRLFVPKLRLPTYPEKTCQKETMSFDFDWIVLRQ